MKKKTARPLLAGAAALFAAMIAGCASVDYSSAGILRNASVKWAKGAESGQVVTINTYGYYLFSTIPLVSGDLRWDPAANDIKGGTSFFQDQVGFYELQNALLKIAESRNCDLAEVYFNDSDGFYAEASYGGIIGSCFGSSQMGVSAILVPRKNTEKQEGTGK